ncbi:uncharacterized protein LOC128548924 isoform X1 [Mercenaria mercenaria]|uniref:uncharacterized protein LOC128548924 isoform X1 n=1 Tax=Mercenaria mercenaria TaxID=6596 RepID=UPI00234EF09D|nr:uncharacterized protein LOC128548924 isoform X1 [Mercenaria mercenaria]
MFRVLCITQLIAIFALTASWALETHRLIKRHDGADIAQDIVHDIKENTVAITVSQTPAHEYLVPTVNFHDFNTKYVVFKDIEHGVCLLTYAPIPFATPSIYKLGRTDLTLAYTAEVQNKILSNDEIRLRAGSNIGDFCADYKTLWMDLIPKHDNKLAKRGEDEPEPCALACGVCIVEADKGYQTVGAANVLG